MKNAIYFVNYTTTGDYRTTGIKLFYKLKDAKAFMSLSSSKGFLTRQDNKGTRLLRFYGGLQPSAQQLREIETITGLDYDTVSVIAAKAHRGAL